VYKQQGIKRRIISSPQKEAGVMFISFLVAGSLLLIPYLFSLSKNPLYIATAIGLLFLFITGAVKTHYTGRNPLRSGVETMLIGGIASLVSYGIGGFVSTLF